MKTFLIILSVLAAAFSHPVFSQDKVSKNSTIKISILGVPPSDVSRINNDYVVDESGNIRMWEIGTVRASGLSATGLAQKIENAYKAAQIYTNPVIQIEGLGAGQIDNQQVTMTGKVGRPGPIQWVQGMTVMQAIASAGGPNTFGTTKRVDIYRDGKKYRLNPLKNDKHKLEKVYPNDVISIDQVKPWETGGR